MNNEQLQFRIARSKIDDVNESWLPAHKDAMECRDCEDELAKLIGAWGWIKQGVETVREAHYLGLIDIAPEVCENVSSVYNSWLQSAERADAQIREQVSRGHTPDNYTEFQACRDEVQAWVSESTWRGLASKDRVERWAKESW
jgi:hypothetical protein